MIKTYNPSKPWLKNENGNDFVVLLLFFIIWPFGAWIYSLFRANLKSSYTIFFLFSLLLCWHMAPTGFTDGYDDFLGIMERFIGTNISTNEIRRMMVAYFSFSDNAPKELYETLLIWFTKTFVSSDNYHFYFLLASIPVAICQLKCFRRITSDARFKAGTIFGVIILVLFIFPRDIITVQNPRFATGLWWNVMACIFYFCDQKHKLLYIAMVLLSPFFHSAMWIFVIIFFSYIVIPLKLRFIEIFALVSIPFSLFSAELLLDFNSNISIMPEFIQGWVEGYLSEESYDRFIARRESGTGFWLVPIVLKLSQKAIYCYMVWLLIKNKKEFENNVEASRFYPFFLWFFACVNMIQSLPEASTRYYYILQLMEAFMWFKAFHFTHKKVVYALFATMSWDIMIRYGYFMGGALSVNTPPDIFFTPLPYLMGKGLFW